MLYNLWKMFNPLENGGGNPLEQAKKKGIDPANFFTKNGIGMPFDSNMHENNDWVNDYVQNLLKESLPQYHQHPDRNSAQTEESIDEDLQSTEQIPYEIFEMHDYIIVRVPLPQGTNLEQISLSLVDNRLIVKGHPDKEELSINLPSLPSQKKIGAKYKNNVIEVRLRKRLNESVIPISIRFD